MELYQTAGELRTITLHNREELKVLNAGLWHLGMAPSRFHPIERQRYFRFAEDVADAAYSETDWDFPFRITGNEVAIAMTGIAAVANRLLDTTRPSIHSVNTIERDALALSMASELEQATSDIS